MNVLLSTIKMPFDRIVGLLKKIACHKYANTSIVLSGRYAGDNSINNKQIENI